MRIPYLHNIKEGEGEGEIGEGGVKEEEVRKGMYGWRGENRKKKEKGILQSTKTRVDIITMNVGCL